MLKRSRNRRTSSETKRSIFTPWKLFTCLLAIGLWVGTFSLLETIIPGDTTNAVTRQVDGGIEFSIKSLKAAWLEVVAILTLFGYLALVFWWFWDRLSDEFNRTRGTKVADSRGGCLEQILVYGFGGVLVAVIVIIFSFAIIVQPLTRIHRITVHGDVVQLDSLYRSWKRPRRDILRVEITRQEDEGRGGPYAEHRAIIYVRDGGRFRTVSDLRARPPGGQDDRRYKNFFDDLRDALTKKP